MKSVSSNLQTFALAAVTFSSNILQIFFFLDFFEGLTWSLCSIMLLLTPVRSKVFHANTSMFLSRNDSNSVPPSSERS
jgi:hypothetical protein